MFDSSLITYAVSLHFSQKVNEVVISTLQAIADKTGNHFMIENKIPPHITIGAFHAAKADEAKLLQYTILQEIIILIQARPARNWATQQEVTAKQCMMKLNGLRQVEKLLKEY